MSCVPFSTAAAAAVAFPVLLDDGVTVTVTVTVDANANAGELTVTAALG